MPSPKWLEKKYHRKWQGYDSANTSIGQGYVLINPMQLAVMPARLASGKLLQPRLLMAGQAQADPRPRRRSGASADRPRGDGRASSTARHGGRPRSCRSTACRWPARREPRRSSGSVERGHQGNWALRDHALFIAFAPADKPRYAIGCIIEHGGFGASAAAPIVRDIDDLFVRPAEGLGRARAARAAMGRHAGRAQRAPTRGLQVRHASPRPGMITSAIIPRPLARLPWRLDLPRRRDRRVRPDRPLFGGGRFDPALGAEAGHHLHGLPRRSRSPCRG